MEGSKTYTSLKPIFSLPMRGKFAVLAKSDLFVCSAAKRDRLTKKDARLADVSL
jgi:hypothetical protein